MKSLARKFASWLSLIFILLSLENFAQTPVPVFQLDLLTAEKTLFFYGPTLEKILAYNVPYNIGQCNSSFGVFKFRINKAGVVDSIEVKGHLDETIVKKVKENIYSTSKQWKMPDPATETKDYWFEYPFFEFGRKEDCDKLQRSKFEELELLHGMLSDNKINPEDTILQLRPNAYIPLSIK